jgi:hypothetical protein
LFTIEQVDSLKYLHADGVAIGVADGG